MFDFLYNSNGRISRKGYVIAFLTPYLILTFVVAPMLGAGGVMLFALFFLWPKNITVPMRRFHDMGITGKYQFGFIGLIILAKIIATKGFIIELGGLEAMSEMSMEEQMTAMEEAIKTGGNSTMMLGTFLIFGVELAQMLLFGLVKGDAGSNSYGNDPLADGRGFAD